MLRFFAGMVAASQLLVPMDVQATTFTVRQQILPIRVMVVDSSQRIIGDWTNIQPTDREYELQFRTDAVNGPLLTTTAALRQRASQYLEVLDQTRGYQTTTRSLREVSDGQWQEVISVVEL